MNIVEIPNAIPQHMLNAVAASWPSPDWQYWHRYQNATADKFGTVDRCRIPYAIQAALDHLAAVVGERMPDDCFIDYDLHAAGCHMMPPGGFLGRHLDAVRHPVRPWRRRFSIVCNVNAEWVPEWGGHLCIDGEPPIVPQPGTAIMFATEDCWHRVTQVSQDADWRMTLALFAWSVDGVTAGNTQAMFRDN